MAKEGHSDGDTKQKLIETATTRPFNKYKNSPVLYSEPKCRERFTSMLYIYPSHSPPKKIQPHHTSRPACNQIVEIKYGPIFIGFACNRWRTSKSRVTANQLYVAALALGGM